MGMAEKNIDLDLLAVMLKRGVSKNKAAEFWGVNKIGYYMTLYYSSEKKLIPSIRVLYGIAKILVSYFPCPVWVCHLVNL